MKKPAARSKHDRVPKRDRNCDWNSNSETALNCQTTLKWLEKAVKRKWNYIDTALKRPSNNAQATLRRPSHAQLQNGPETTPKQRSNEPQTHWNNQLNQHVLTIIWSGAQTLRNQRWPGHYTLRPSSCPAHPDSRSGYRSACLAAYKPSKLLHGRSWLYWGASTLQKLSHTCLRPVRRA